ncbi:hypothetical protein DIE15_33655 [Burkholderia sp. Bp9031]|uniref:hypothetical protein n=1 Tax=Burkholderia sp. Bp9031 TaxID=2184566 RepID=UPI000F5FB7C3|nr:hypothetical protein [Burkholderia sp. Bp9031]RQZ07545.1 hypothetical protein DIE15_33655 [Burkholderia sp. Bp9031]
MTTPPDAPAFILEAIDEHLLSPCLATRFRTADLAKLKSILAIEDDDDPSVDKVYLLSPHETTALCSAFGVRFDSGRREVFLFKDCRRLPRSPYLFHTGYELPLLLDGRKKLAFFTFDSDDGLSFDSRLKACFDHFVAAGLLHGEENLDILPNSPGRRVGYVYYAAKGEEWRIPAFRLLRQAAGAAGGWNETFERLEGTLMGYEDWQNDWWLEQQARGNGVLYGMSFRCAVTKAGLDWVIQSGNRALPPVEGPTLTIQASHALNDEVMDLALREDADIEAFIQFNVPGRHLMGVCDLRTAGPFLIPATMISDVNRKLTRQVQIVARR